VPIERAVEKFMLTVLYNGWAATYILYLRMDHRYLRV
jgi:hypothetical protein